MEAKNYSHPIERLKYLAEKKPNESWMHEKINGSWVSYNCSEIYSQSRKIANHLLSSGLVPGDKVAIIAKNSPQWMISDFALMLAGLISVPIYSTASKETISYVLEHSQSKAIFIGRLEQTNNIDQVINESENDLIVYAFPDFNAEKSFIKYNWEEMLNSTLIDEKSLPDKNSTISIVYTSGSTGNPKGVILSFNNFAASASAFVELFEDREKQRVLSYLPLAHITERTIVAYSSLYKLSDIYFNSNLESFLDDLHFSKPTSFFTVPRLWAKFQSQVLSQIDNETLNNLLDSPDGALVSAGIREKLGFSACDLYGSGAAPISSKMLDWWRKLGINISEGWGMTETSGGVCNNTPFDEKNVGTIGFPLSCATMKLSNEGEILVKGPAVFEGYYRNKNATLDAFDEEGWFRTGDKGEQSNNGSFRIIGRLKEEFKTAKGKYVAPVPIESHLLGLSYIEQVIVFGSGRAQPMAVIVLNEGYFDSMDDRLDKNEKRKFFENEFLKDLDSINNQLETHCQLDTILMSSKPFDINNGLLTPTLKLRREAIEKEYSKYIYSEKVGIIWE